MIDHCGVIESISHQFNSIRLSIAHQFTDIKLGESICVDGVCLTVTHAEHTHFSCDLSPETMQLTRSKNYRVKDVVNLERSLRLSDRLSGHMVTGHVDGMLKVLTIEKQGEFVYLAVTGINIKHAPLLTSKGSVCINGVSLTVNSVEKEYFSVLLIPHTLEMTNLKKLQHSSMVNIEYDYLAKLVQRNVQLLLEKT